MAKEFAENARKLREQMEREALGPEPSVEHTGRRADNFVDAAADLHAKTYSEARIIPEIDSLVNSHTDGTPISKEQLEKTYKKIMSNMVEDGVLTQKEMDAYTAPEKIEKKVRVKVEDPGVGQRLGAFFKGKKAVYRDRTVVEDGPSQFQKDIQSSMVFNDKGQVDAPNLTSLKDKILHGLSKICTNLGFSSLSRSCRKAMSVDNQEKINKIEAGAVEMTKKIAKQAKIVGSSVGSESGAKRIAKQTQNIVANRQKQDSGRSR